MILHPRIICLLCIICFFMTSEVFAADRLTLQDTIQLALENSSNYKIAREKVSENSIKIRGVWGQLWPELSTDISGSRMWAQKGMNTIETGLYSISFIKGSIAINPGDFYNRLKAAREDHIASVYEERSVKADITVSVIQLYYQLLLNTEIIKFRSDSLKALEENMKAITAGYRGGAYTQLDFLRARVSAANERTRLIIAENDYQSTQASLNILIGHEIDMPLNTDEQTIFSDLNEARTYGDWSQPQKKEQYRYMISQALKNRPELFNLSARKESRLAAADAKESVYLWPTLFASGSYGTNKIISKPVQKTGDQTIDSVVGALMPEFVPQGWNRNWNITVGATYQWGALSPLDSSHAKEGEYRSQTRQYDLALEEFIKETRLQVQKGILKLNAASNSILSQMENIRSAEESLRVAIIQFKSGVIDNTKLLDINAELTSAKSLYYQSLYNFQTAKAELNKSMGIEYFTFRQSQQKPDPVQRNSK